MLRIFRNSRGPESPAKQGSGEFWAVHLVILISLLPQLCCVPATLATQFPNRISPSATTWTVTIVLPDRVVAGQLATLAVFGVDGRLAPGVTVQLESESSSGTQQVTTDQTGRASFTVPAEGSVLMARASGTSAAALVDLAPEKTQPALELPPVVSLRDRFSICATGLRGNADSNRVNINGLPTLVIAASPECVTVLPGQNLIAGPANVSVIILGSDVAAKTTLVSLDFEPPNPPLLPEKKGRLTLRVKGSDSRLRIIVGNQTPGVLRFVHGSEQQLLTSGGPDNFAEVPVQAVSSGDFSFHAWLVPSPSVEAATRYLQVAATLAPKGQQHDLAKLADHLMRHPGAWEQVRSEVQEMITETIAGDLRTVLNAALDAL